MYSPDYGQITDLNEIIDFVHSHPFATLVSSKGDRLLANHIPLEVKYQDDKVRLIGHIAKSNPLSKWLVDGAYTLAIFLSPFHHYISSKFYAKPDAPTWNYQAVHVEGTVRIQTEDELTASLEHLMHRYEDPNWQMNSLPKDVIRLQHQITGLEIDVFNVRASFKLSQNRLASDRKSIVQNLHQIGTVQSKTMANLIEKYKEL